MLNLVLNINSGGDCLTDAAESFYRHFGFEFLCEHGGCVRMFLPMKTVGELFK